MNSSLSKSAKIVFSKSILDVKKWSNFVKKITKNINLGDHYSLRTFFSKLNFWQAVITHRNFLKIFPWWHIDSWPKTLLFRILVVKSNTVQSFFGRIYGALGAAICFRFYLTLNRDMLLLRTLWYLENLSNCNNSFYYTHPISQLKLCQQLFMG